MDTYKITIVSPSMKKTFFTKSDNEFGNPMYETGELTATGSRTFLASDDFKMTETYTIMVTPEQCSFIEIKKVSFIEIKKVDKEFM